MESKAHEAQIASGDDDLSGIDAQDAREMATLGLKQQLRRNFGFFSILGFSCVCMITWEGELITFIYNLENGGSAGSIIGFFVVWVGYAMVVVSMCELMSMWPTSAGQYYWTYVLSSPRAARITSYICAWQSVIAWQAACASACYLGATMIQGLAILNYPDTYTPKLYQGTLIMYAMLVVVVIFNTVLAKWLPHVESAALAIHLAGFLVIIVAVTTLTPRTATAHDVFSVFINSGHWPTQGISFWTGLQGLVFAWLGADGAIHMSEEIQNASTILPRSVMGSIAINGFLGLGMLIAVLFCGGNLNKALESPTGFPIEAIFTFATRSRAGGTGLSCILIMAAILATTSCTAAASREIWAFARDDGLPGSRWLKTVHKSSKLPLWAIGTTVTVTALLALINIGSAIAFNAILSLAVAGFLGSYLLPLPLILYRRTRSATASTLPWGPFKLPRLLGPVINAIGICWCIVVVFWSFWPREEHPSVADMNWSCVAYGGITLLAAGFWFVDGRKRYKGPVKDAKGGQIKQVVGEERLEDSVEDGVVR